MQTAELSPEDRLYLQYRPNKASTHSLLLLQDHYRNAGISGRYVASPGLHLTLLHIGVLENLWQELEAYMECTKGEFYEQVKSYATAMSDIIPDTVTIRTTGYELFGDFRTTVVVRGKVDDSLVDAHARALSSFVMMLMRLGVDEPRTVMRENHNLCYALDFHPHITLIKGAQPAQILGSHDRMTLKFEKTPTIYKARNQK